MPTRYLTPRSSRRLESPVDVADLAATLFEPGDDDCLAVALLGADQTIAGVLLIDRVPSADAVITVVEHLMGALRPSDLIEIEAVVLASRRSTPVDALDGARWSRLDEVCNDTCLALIDWLVVTPTRVSLPREHLGLPSRWPVAPLR